MLINPRSLKAITEKKTDTSDAVWLAHLFRPNLIKPSYVPPQHVRELRALTRRYEKIAQMATSIKNFIQSQMDAFLTGITSIYTDPFGAGGTRILSSLAEEMENMEANHQTHTIQVDKVDKVIKRLWEEGLPPAKVEQAKKMLELSFTPTSRGRMILQRLGMLKELHTSLEEVLDRIAKHIKQYKDLSVFVRLLLSIKGVDLVSAATIVAGMGDPARLGDADDEALKILACDDKVRGELGLCRVMPTMPTISGPVRARLSGQRSSAGTASG